MANYSNFQTYLNANLPVEASDKYYICQKGRLGKFLNQRQQPNQVFKHLESWTFPFLHMLITTCHTMMTLYLYMPVPVLVELTKDNNCKLCTYRSKYNFGRFIYSIINSNKAKTETSFDIYPFQT